MKRTNRAFAKLVSLIAVVMLLVSMAVIPTSATQATANNINDATKGVFLIIYTYTPPVQPDAPNIIMSGAVTGTGFLVNEDTVVTAYHIFHDPDVVARLRVLYGDDYLSKMQIRVYYKSGAFVKATEIQAVSNSTYDFTALKLATPINGALQLTLADNVDDTTLRSPTPVYALGYPYTTVQFQEWSEASFTPKDVDTKNGIMNKFEAVDGIRLIKHTAMTLEGMSGGPLIDDRGLVIGINRLKSTVTESENWAVPSFNLIDSLTQMNIPFLKADFNGGAPITEPASENDVTEPTEIVTEAPAPELDFSALNAKIEEASALKESDYKSGFSEMTAMLNAAKSTLTSASSQEEIQAALSDLTAAMDNLEAKGSGNMTMIIIIAAAAAVLIAIVIIVIVVMKKKKNEDDFDAGPAFPPAGPAAPGGFNGPAGGFNPAPQGNGGFAPVSPAVAPRVTPVAAPTAAGGAETSVLSSGGSETTVLSSGGNETTVLGGKPYAKLTRKSNNEMIQVSAPTFVIGKERRKVNYCIEDNSTISRSHAQIMKNGSNVCVMDLGSKNGTFVNGVKCANGESVTVRNGDKITLSDEDFIITLL